MPVGLAAVRVALIDTIVHDADVGGAGVAVEAVGVAVAVTADVHVHAGAHLAHVQGAGVAVITL